LGGLSGGFFAFFSDKPGIGSGDDANDGQSITMLW
jgi:hypothetical protein